MWLFAVSHVIMHFLWHLSSEIRGISDGIYLINRVDFCEQRISWGSIQDFMNTEIPLSSFYNWVIDLLDLGRYQARKMFLSCRASTSQMLQDDNCQNIIHHRYHWNVQSQTRRRLRLPLPFLTLHDYQCLGDQPVSLVGHNRRTTPVQDQPDPSPVLIHPRPASPGFVFSSMC